MAAPDAALAHYTAQAALAAATVAALDTLWAQVDPTAIDRSWTAISPLAVSRITAAQVLAASRADPYATAVLTELGIDATATARIRPVSFAGTASDGRPLGTLLDSPVIAARQAIAGGADLGTALERGRYSLARIGASQVQDAGRVAVGTAIAARPTVTRWVRMLNPPSCSRCAVLAGRVYAWNRGFARHPQCDCVHIPSTESIAGDLTTDPRGYFDSLAEADQDRYFTAAGAEAIRGGADVGQVVNARRGMYTTVDGQRATSEGVTRRGVFGAREIHAGAGTATGAGRYTATTTVRLMPEAILEQAGSRSEAVDLLRRYGFLA